MSQNVWATIMPFGPVTNFLLAQLKLALISGTAVKGFIYTILEED
jgi:hypothetical protein